MKIAPSVLAADLSDLASAVEICEQGQADLVHLDVMDGHFVPNLTFGFPVIDALAERTDVPFDIHLMVERPGELMEHYLACKPHWVSFHWEAGGHADRLVHQIKDAGAGAGIALNPATPIDVLTDVLEELDFVLLMSVNPGFAGQPFVGYVLDKCRRLRAEIDAPRAAGRYRDGRRHHAWPTRSRFARRAAPLPWSARESTRPTTLLRC